MNITGKASILINKYLIGIGYSTILYSEDGIEISAPENTSYFYATKKNINDIIQEPLDIALSKLDSTIGDNDINLKNNFDRLKQEYTDIKIKKQIKDAEKSLILCWVPNDGVKKYYSLEIKFGPEFDKDEILPLKNTLEKIIKINVNKNTITSVQPFGTKITPKSIVFMVNAHKERIKNVNEAIEITGTTKSSYHAMPDAKIIIRHKDIVDDKKFSARSKNVKSMYIQSKSGERRLIPSKNLYSAKALVNYIKNGGNIFDNTASAILTLGEDILALRKFHNSINFTEDTLSNLSSSIIKSNMFIIKLLNTSKITDYIAFLNFDDIVFYKSFFENKIKDCNCIDSYARGNALLIEYRKAIIKDLLNKITDEISPAHDKIAEDIVTKTIDKNDLYLGNIINDIYEKYKNGNINSIEKDFIKNIINWSK